MVPGRPEMLDGVGAERAKTQTEVLNVVFKDANGNTFTYNAKDYATWQSFKIGQKYTVDINRLNQVQCDTLKMISAQ